MARRVRRNKNKSWALARARAEPDSGIIFIASSLAKGGQSSIIYNMTIPSRELQSHCMRSLALLLSILCFPHTCKFIFSLRRWQRRRWPLLKRQKRERKTLSLATTAVSLFLPPDYFLHCQRKETQKFENFLAGVISSGSLFLQLGFKLIIAESRKHKNLWDFPFKTIAWEIKFSQFPGARGLGEKATK